MDLDPAPPEILDVIHWKCKSSSKRQCSRSICSCRKNGLHRASACSECHGCNSKNASNDSRAVTDDDDDPSETYGTEILTGIFDLFDN